MLRAEPKRFPIAFPLESASLPAPLMSAEPKPDMSGRTESHTASLALTTCSPYPSRRINLVYERLVLLPGNSTPNTIIRCYRPGHWLRSEERRVGKEWRSEWATEE